MLLQLYGYVDSNLHKKINFCDVPAKVFAKKCPEQSRNTRTGIQRRTPGSIRGCIVPKRIFLIFVPRVCRKWAPVPSSLADVDLEGYPGVFVPDNPCHGYLSFSLK